MKLNLAQGREVVSFARKVIELHFEGLRAHEPESLSELFRKERGVFVTLDTYPGRELRGCIGYPEPVMQFGRALAESARAAAFGDSRFPPLAREELPEIVVEVSVLTQPEKITVGKPLDYLKQVEVGRDGLIVRKGWASGLLLPQVAVEHGWDAEKFLSHACVKAGLSPDAWLTSGAKIHKFSAQVFSEETPKGKVIENTFGRSSCVFG